MGSGVSIPLEVCLGPHTGQVPWAPECCCSPGVVEWDPSGLSICRIRAGVKALLCLEADPVSALALAVPEMLINGRKTKKITRGLRACWSVNDPGTQALMRVWQSSLITA